MVAEALGVKLEDVALAELGGAKRAVIDKDPTTIISGAGDKNGIDGRCDERTGIRILRRALEFSGARSRPPTRQVADNSGADAGIGVDKMRSSAGNLRFDASSNQYVDLPEAGIVNPTKIVRMALENAVSVASTPLLTEATMTEGAGTEENAVRTE